MDEDQGFSKRLGYSGRDREIRIREDAPESLRYCLPKIAGRFGLSAATTRSIVCEVLRTPPNRENCSAESVTQETESLLMACAWHHVYDVAEELLWRITDEEGDWGGYMETLNDVFREEGIGWQVDTSTGQIVSRGEIEFEVETRGASETLDLAGYQRARGEFQQAIADLSRRPEPDLTGAIQHAMAAMECVAREFCGESQPTFGKLNTTT
jgi:hypothetical protein